jgi:hypothetical protein
MTNIIKTGLLAGIAGLGFLVTNFGSAAETGVIAKSSNYSAPETIQSSKAP